MMKADSLIIKNLSRQRTMPPSSTYSCTKFPGNVL